MTESISVAIEGEGDHEIMAETPNSWITLFRTLLPLRASRGSDERVGLMPAGWYFALRRIAGTTATINSATDQSLG